MFAHTRPTVGLMVSSAATDLWAAFEAAPKQIDMPLEQRRAAGEQAESPTSEPDGVGYEDVPEVHGLAAVADAGTGASVGGGYVLGSPTSRRKTAGHVARASGARVVVPDYRVAPEHPFPAAVDYAVAAYRALIELGAPASRTVVMGDSSGGGVAVATLLALPDEGDPLPAGVVTMSAWADLPLHRCDDGLERRRRHHGEPRGAPPDGRLVPGGHSRDRSARFAVSADLAELPPLLALAGGDEVLLDDSIRLIRGFGEGGADATLFRS
jgi:epsilon-lactone hydrolase